MSQTGIPKKKEEEKEILADKEKETTVDWKLG